MLFLVGLVVLEQQRQGFGGTITAPGWLGWLAKSAAPRPSSFMWQLRHKGTHNFISSMILWIDAP